LERINIENVHLPCKGLPCKSLPRDCRRLALPAVKRLFDALTALRGFFENPCREMLARRTHFAVKQAFQNENA
jgi:hypothetical protein